MFVLAVPLPVYSKVLLLSVSLGFYVSFYSCLRVLCLSWHKLPLGSARLLSRLSTVPAASSLRLLRATIVALALVRKSTAGSGGDLSHIILFFAAAAVHPVPHSWDLVFGNIGVGGGEETVPKPVGSLNALSNAEKPFSLPSLVAVLYGINTARPVMIFLLPIARLFNHFQIMAWFQRKSYLSFVLAVAKLFLLLRD